MLSNNIQFTTIAHSKTFLYKEGNSSVHSKDIRTYKSIQIIKYSKYILE